MKIIEDEPKGVGRPVKYPWDEWLVHNKTVRLYRGDDFRIAPDSLRPQIHAQAKRRGGTVKTSLGQEGPVDYIDVRYEASLTEGDFNFDDIGPK